MLLEAAAEGDQQSLLPEELSGEQSPKENMPNLKAEDKQFIDEFRNEVQQYINDLKMFGLKDHQVRQIDWWTHAELVQKTVYLLIIFVLGALPQLICNMPPVVLARMWAASEQKKALKSSKVKLQGRDVLMSYKVIYVLSLVPALWITYAVLLLCFSNLQKKTVFLLFLHLPVFGFLGMKASEQGMKGWRDLRPLLVRLKPSSRSEQDKLPAKRARLQKRLDKAIKMFGPTHLKDIYYPEVVNWGKELGKLERTDSMPRREDSGQLRKRVSSGGAKSDADASGDTKRTS